MSRKMSKIDEKFCQKFTKNFQKICDDDFNIIFEELRWECNRKAMNEFLLFFHEKNFFFKKFSKNFKKFAKI